MNIDELNDRQKEAVLQTDGAILIVAGAGSGKTKVLTNKVAYLIYEKGIDPYNILAITFTNKAAKEMKGRIIKLIGEKANFAQISTFHSLGVKILKDNSELLGYQRSFVILDSDDQLTVIKKIIKDIGLDPKKYNPKGIKGKISGAKNELVDENEYAKYANTEFEQIVHKVYKKYQKKLKDNNSMDFDDLLILPIKLFKDNPDVLKQYQERFKYILVDEYQDTNEAQYSLVKMLSAKYQNICVVGDSDQSIFSWRGANFKNILDFEKDYKNTKVILLEENYRSTKNILEAANNVIKNNKLRKEKKLWTSKEEGKKIHCFEAFNERDEAFYVIRRIKELRDEGVKSEDIAVLYRTNAQSRIVEEEFLKANIPYRVVGSFFFYSRKEIKDLIAYLRMILNPHDDISLLRVINTPKRGIGNKSIENLTREAIEKNDSIYDIIVDGKAKDFKDIIENLVIKKEGLTLTEIIDLILDETKMKETLINEKTLESDIRLENLEEFKSITKSFEEKYGTIDLLEFLNEITLVSDISEHREEVDAVSLMTLHAVKGLEFKYVFIVGLEEGIFPHINSVYENDLLEEERRLCYVGITRAEKELYLLNAKSRMLFGKTQNNAPSRFVKEIGVELLVGQKEKRTAKKDMFVKENRSFEPGDVVQHEKYGVGTVIKAETMIVTIAFKQQGIKKLLKNHKSLTKV